MATGKETPRQKMIGMMYLVLLALLAMNVSKDILDAFITVNTGLENTVSGIHDKNQQTYLDFKQQMLVDEAKVKQYYNKALQVEQFSKNMTAYINKLKAQLIAETDGIPLAVADTIALANINNKDNYDIPTRIMIGSTESGSKGKARELKNKLEAYKKQLNSVLDATAIKKLKLNFKTTDPPTTTEGKRTWEVATFYHSPIVATITLLSKIEADIKNAEYDVLKELFRGIRKKDFTFDTLAAKVISPSNYVLLGSEYKAEIMLAAFSTTQNPEIKIGEYNPKTSTYLGNAESVNVTRGIGNYITKPLREGLHIIKGLLKIKDQEGNITPYPFESSFIAAKPALVVSADNMNVMYQGVVNPISVSVPGVPDQNLRIVPSNNLKLTKTSSGKYNAVVDGGLIASVTVMADFGEGNVKNMGKMEFRVKRVPQPELHINKIKGGSIKKAIMQNMPLLAEMDNFQFPANWEVESYDFVYPGRLPETNKSKFPVGNVKAMMEGLRKGDVVTFKSIKIRGTGSLVGERRTLPSSITFDIQY